MAMAKSTVDVKILIDEREIITGPSGPVIRDIEQVPSGYRFALREIDETVQPGEEKVIKRQIGQGVKTIEAAKAKALKTKPPKATRRQRDVLDGAPNSKPRKQNRRNNGIDQAVELLFRNGIKPAYRNEVDKVLVDLVKKADRVSARVVWTRPAEWEECAVFRHAMGIYYGSDIPRPEYGWMLGARCERCGTKRFSNVDPDTGKLVRPSTYKWPKGYRYAPGEDKPSAADLRLHMIRKVKREKPNPRPVRAPVLV